jgi:acyl-CoA thioester hydrolase
VARYLYHCALRWSDLDAYGHVNNARFLTLFEEARVALMFLGARATGLTSFEQGVVISRHEIDYLRPVDYSPPAEHRLGAPVDVAADGHGQAPRVRVEMWVEDIRASRFVIGYELFDRGVVASRARSICVPFDLGRQRPRRLTDAEQQFLQPWRE